VVALNTVHLLGKLDGPLVREGPGWFLRLAVPRFRRGMREPGYDFVRVFAHQHPVADDLSIQEGAWVGVVAHIESGREQLDSPEQVVADELSTF
jgi:hypothetical protein